MRPGHHGVHVSAWRLFVPIRSVITGTADRDISRLPKILQPFGQSAVTHTKILGTAANTKFLVIEIVLDSIQFKLFVMLLCRNEILLLYDTSIVSYIVYLGFSHFDLHYLYSSIRDHAFQSADAALCQGKKHPLNTIVIIKIRFLHDLLHCGRKNLILAGLSRFYTYL